MGETLRWADVDPGRGAARGEPYERLVAKDRSMPDWPGFLAQLAVRFAELREETRGLAVPHAVERAAAALLPLVVHHTALEEDWYTVYDRAVCWYLLYMLEAVPLRLPRNTVQDLMLAGHALGMSNVDAALESRLTEEPGAGPARRVSGQPLGEFDLAS